MTGGAVVALSIAGAFLAVIGSLVAAQHIMADKRHICLQIETPPLIRFEAEKDTQVTTTQDATQNASITRKGRFELLHQNRPEQKHRNSYYLFIVTLKVSDVTLEQGQRLKDLTPEELEKKWAEHFEECCKAKKMLDLSMHVEKICLMKALEREFDSLYVFEFNGKVTAEWVACALLLDQRNDYPSRNCIVDQLSIGPYLKDLRFSLDWKLNTDSGGPHTRQVIHFSVGEAKVAIFLHEHLHESERAMLRKSDKCYRISCKYTTTPCWSSKTENFVPALILMEPDKPLNYNCDLSVSARTGNSELEATEISDGLAHAFRCELHNLERTENLSGETTELTELSASAPPP